MKPPCPHLVKSEDKHGSWTCAACGWHFDSPTRPRIRGICSGCRGATELGHTFEDVNARAALAGWLVEMAPGRTATTKFLCPRCRER